MKRFKGIIGNISHGVLGFIAMMLLIKGYFKYSILLIIIFSLYQLLDYFKGEDYKNTLTDVQEFLIGMAVAIVYYSINILGIPIPIL